MIGNDMITRTHHFWSSAYAIIGKAILAKIYKVSHRQIERWGADPDFCVSAAANPIDRIRAVCVRLIELGRRDVVEGGLLLLLNPLGYDLMRQEICTDKGSIALELLDVASEAGKLSNAYLTANEDHNISADEQVALRSLADNLGVQVEQLKDAIQNGKEVC